LVISAALLWQGLRLRHAVRSSNAVLEQTQRERQAVIQYLNNMAKPLRSRDMSLGPSLDVIVQFVMDMTQADGGACYLINDDDGALHCRSILGMFPPLQPFTTYVLTKQKHLYEKIKREKIEIGSGLIGEAASKRKAYLVTDPASDSRIPRTALDMSPFSSIMVAPLVFDKRVLGVLAVVKGSSISDQLAESIQNTGKSMREAAEFLVEDLSLLTALAEQAASTVEMVRLFTTAATEEVARQTMEKELGLAHEFQQMLLPNECPNVPGYDVAVFSRPAREVGGDYYDVFWVDDDKRYLGLVIADVSGKGIPGAFVMAMTRSALRVLSRNRLNPLEVMLRCNDRLYEDTKENVFVTTTYGILDTSTGIFRYVRAGHEPLLKFSKGGQEIIQEEPSGIALGMVPTEDLQAVLEEKTTVLSPGMGMLLYTDGVVEAENSEGDEFGRDVFLKFMLEHEDLSPEPLIAKVVEEIDKFANGISQHDDITLLAIQFHDNQALASATAASIAPV